MGAELSYQDFTACSPQPTAGSRISYIYQPSSTVSSNPANDPATMTTVPYDRVKSAPVARYDVTSVPSATPTASVTDSSANDIGFGTPSLRLSNGLRSSQRNTNSKVNVSRLPSETGRESRSSSQLRLSDDFETRCNCACHDSNCATVTSLRSEVLQLKTELAQSQQAVTSLKQNEVVLRQRLSEQALRQIEKGSTKFEDLSLGNMRPTQLIRRYGNLYSEGRLDALDALDDIPEMSNFDDLKGKLLLTILVLSFRNAHKNIAAIKAHIRHLLHIPSINTSPCTTSESIAVESTTKELDDVVSVYLRKTVDRFDLSRNFKEVCDRVWDTLYDFPSLRHCSGLLRYIEECVRLAWALSVQVQPFAIHYEQSCYLPDLHTRFHTSDPSSDTVKTVLWPTLTEGVSGPCVFKGVVIT